jgi:hypothetical protein
VGRDAKRLGEAWRERLAEWSRARRENVLCLLLIVAKSASAAALSEGGYALLVASASDVFASNAMSS